MAASLYPVYLLVSYYLISVDLFQSNLILIRLNLILSSSHRGSQRVLNGEQQKVVELREDVPHLASLYTILTTDYIILSTC